MMKNKFFLYINCNFKHKCKIKTESDTDFFLNYLVKNNLDLIMKT